MNPNYSFNILIDVHKSACKIYSKGLKSRTIARPVIVDTAAPECLAAPPSGDKRNTPNNIHICSVRINKSMCNNRIWTCGAISKLTCAAADVYSAVLPLTCLYGD